MPSVTHDVDGYGIFNRYPGYRGPYLLSAPCTPKQEQEYEQVAAAHQHQEYYCPE